MLSALCFRLHQGVGLFPLAHGRQSQCSTPAFLSKNVIETGASLTQTRATALFGTASELLRGIAVGEAAPLGLAPEGRARREI